MSTAPAPAGDATSVPPSSSDTLTCKACGRTMVVISAAGDMQPQGELDDGCDLCRQFLAYYNEYEEVKGCFKKLEHRRDDYQPRIQALEWVHRAQMRMGNFVEEVVAWEKPGEVGKTPAEPQEEQSQKHSDSPTQEPAQEHTRNAHLRPRKRSLSPQSSSGPHKLEKRPRLSDGRSRRISFDSSVVFRDAESESRRVDAEFSRNSDGYRPGRWTAPEGSEWLDTSGSSTTIVKFTGVSKRGQKWVPTKEGIRMDEEWENAGVDERAEGEEVREAGDRIGGEGHGEDEDESKGLGTSTEEDLPQEEPEPSARDLAPSSTFGPFPEPDPSDQEFAPDLEPSAHAAQAGVGRDESHSSDEDVATKELPVAAPLNDQEAEKDEAVPGEEWLRIGMGGTV